MGLNDEREKLTYARTLVNEADPGTEQFGAALDYLTLRHGQAEKAASMARHPAKHLSCDLQIVPVTGTSTVGPDWWDSKTFWTEYLGLTEMNWPHVIKLLRQAGNDALADRVASWYLNRK